MEEKIGQLGGIMSTLTFYVKGSAKEPYRVIAEAEGQELRAFCSCPAGRRGGVFCKHIAYLLQGDVSKLVSLSAEDVMEFARRAVGSPFLAKSDARVDRDARLAVSDGLHSLEDVLAKFKSEIEGLGWTIVFVKNEGERDEDRLELYARFKNGNLRKTPSIAFECVRKDYDYADFDWDVGSSSSTADATPPPLRARERPFGIRTTSGQSVGKTWRHLAEPVPVFLELARRGPTGKF